MFMLTHTYFLQKYLAMANLKDVDLDIYVYNVVPDLLTINPQITPNKTHNVQRTLQIPTQYSRAEYVLFHLLVDDMSHYGYISSKGHKEFDSNSAGYSYLKGKYLINSIMDLYKFIGRKISCEEAIYQSHLIIEMIYDLVILNQINSLKTIDLLVDSINFTTKYGMDEFVATINWLYNIKESDIADAIIKASSHVTKKKMESIMNISGRINLYREKFGLKTYDQIFCNDIRKLFLYARDLIDENDSFFQDTTQTINEYGWKPTFK